jgi:hypothetical protein
MASRRHTARIPKGRVHPNAGDPACDLQASSMLVQAVRSARGMPGLWRASLGTPALVCVKDLGQFLGWLLCREAALVVGECFGWGAVAEG